MPTRCLIFPLAKRLPLIFRSTFVILGCLSLSLRKVSGQDVLTTPPQTPAIPLTVHDYETNNAMQVFTAPEETAPAFPIQCGPVVAHPHADYQFLYGNGIESSPGDSQSSIVQTVSPGVLLNLGEHWTLDYSPTLAFYSNKLFRNTLDQSARLGWGTSYDGDWFLSASQSYASAADPNVITAAQTDQEAYATALNATHQINDEVSLDLGLSQNLEYVGNGGDATNSELNLENSMNWSTLNWLNYQFWPRLNAGLGLGLGYDQPEGGPNSIYQLYQSRINWRATDKLSFQVSGGVENQQYLNGGGEPLLTPVFAATVEYQPVERTTLSVTGSRTVNESIFQNEITENTGCTVELNQCLLENWHLDVSARYGSIDYLASSAGQSASRSDEFLSTSIRLSCPLRERTTISLFYSYSDNSSRQNGFASSTSSYAFASSQVGFEIEYQY